jgi:hypothetical protein
MPTGLPSKIVKCFTALQNDTSLTLEDYFAYGFLRLSLLNYSFYFITNANNNSRSFRVPYLDELRNVDEEV